jgi:hypothetical protein
VTDESDRFELTRRDVLSALGAAGVAAGGGAVAASSALDADTDERTGTPAPGAAEGTTESLSEHELSTVVAVASITYPSAVENVEAFVTQYVRGRVADDPDRAAAISDTVTYVDNYVDTWYDEDTYTSLSADNQNEALHKMGADRVTADPTAGSVQQVRYYLVNDPLFALYASPTGGELVGLENPQGYPGGTRSYQRGPQS